MSLTADQVAGFTKTFLLKHYDNPVLTPHFHWEMWEDCCSEDQFVAIAAPRAHAKSTAITLAYVLTSLLFRENRYTLIVANTEAQSINFLDTIKQLLKHDEDIIREFGVKRMTKENQTTIIVEMQDGYKFRVDASSAGSAGVRGTKWVNLRPDLIVGDDLENDEMVESETRREKFQEWFFKALIPCLSPTGKVRIVGTILHMGAALQKLIDNNEWRGKIYKAHKSFNDFSSVLWPEQWNAETLRKKQLNYIEQGTPEYYSQEYLNDPVDQHDQYFKQEDFLEMEEEHYRSPKLYFGAVDFAISDKDKNAYTVLVVGGMDSENMLNIVNVMRFRGNAEEIINNILLMQQRYNVEFWKMERGQISMAIQPALINTAMSRNVMLNIKDAVPTKDKRSRASSIQARMKMGGVRFDMKSSWYAGFLEELLHFPRGMFKDQVDAFSWLGIAVNELVANPTDREIEEDEYDAFVDEYDDATGASFITGY